MVSRTRLVVGLMSGTSLDGVDAAAIETDGVTVARFGPSLTIPYEPGLRARLRALLDLGDALSPATPGLATIEREVTAVFAGAVRALGVAPALVGMHGQTILHRPKRGLTWQLGDAPLLARALGVPVVHDFRGADVAAGGEGAPLVPLFHAALLPAGLPRPAAILNIGGVANVTWVPDDPDGLLACDTGPGNAPIDDFVRGRTGLAFDADGALGLAGTPDEAVLARLLAHPFFSRPAPKSLDRLDFSHALDAVAGLSLEDGCATLAAFAARAVVTALPGALPGGLPGGLHVCGGGRRNGAIMRALEAALGAAVHPAEALGWDGDALEAQCFAYLAVRSVERMPLSLPGTTGVPRPMSGGRLALPG